MMKKSRVVKGVLETLDDVSMRRAAARLLSFCFRLVNFSGLNFKSWLLHTFGLLFMVSTMLLMVDVSARRSA